MIFERIVAGVDGSTESLNSCRLAARLRAPGGQVTAITVAETAYAMHAGIAAPEWAWRLRAEAEAKRERVLREFEHDAGVQARVDVGNATERLLAAVATADADLIAVGSHGLGRAAGMVLGSVATSIIHCAPCSVLVARGSMPRTFPCRILVGIDGSGPAAEAEAVAELIADSSGAELRRLFATGDRDSPYVSTRADFDERKPVDALVDYSSAFDLLIVGSRGSCGIASLGSVAERVAHQAACPVLIVRRPPLIAARRTADFATVSE